MINNIETHFSLNNEKSKTNKYEKVIIGLPFLNENEGN